MWKHLNRNETGGEVNFNLALCPWSCQAAGMSEFAPDNEDASPVLEVCCGSAAFAVSALAAGADRVELCDNLVEGGTTPSSGSVSITLERATGPVMAMIRPRGGDFLYSSLEFDVMLRDIKEMKNLGVAGVVFGVLLPDGRVDGERVARLVDAARPLSVTFHRAFDVSLELNESLELLLELGIDRVLTSAGRKSVLDDLPRLEELARLAGEDLTILACGGIRAHNVARVLSTRGVKEIHIGASRTVPSAMTHRVDGIPMGREYAPDEYLLEEADTDSIASIASILDR